MQDIADAVGLSQSTVSLALRNHPRIPEATRERIAKTASEMGYQSNAPISTLMARIRANRPIEQHATIAAITSHLADQKRRHKPAFHANWKGAKKRARQLGYQLEEFALDREGMTATRLGDILKARHIEGIIVFPFFPPGKLDLPWEHFSSVTIGYNLTEPKINRVSADQYGAMKTAIDQLRSRGYQRPGMVVDAQLNDRNERRWMSPFCGYEFNRDTNLKESILLINGKDATGFRHWLDTYRPDVIIGCGMLPIRKWIESHGLCIPKDIGLIGISDAFFYTQDCAYVNENQALVGSAAIDQVVAELQRNERGIPKQRTELFMPGQWVDGDTLHPSSIK